MNDELLDDPDYRSLARLVHDKSCVAFIGSGLSTSEALYPSWEELIRRLCVACGVPLPSPEDLQDADTLFQLADRACDRNQDEYCRVLMESFGRPVVETRRAYDLLMRLQLKGYVTTNFDPLLAMESRKPEHRCGAVYTFPALPVHDIANRAVYYIHGMIEIGATPKPDQVLLGKRGFEEAYSNDGGTLNSFLHQVLTFQPLFLIGCSLREPPLRGLFETCRNVRVKILRDFPGQSAPPRYALLPMRFLRNQDARTTERDIEEETGEARRFSELDIKVIRYNPRDEKHSRIEEILDEWCELAPVTRSPGF